MIIKDYNRLNDCLGSLIADAFKGGMKWEAIAAALHSAHNRVTAGRGLAHKQEGSQAEFDRYIAGDR